MCLIQTQSLSSEAPPEPKRLKLSNSQRLPDPCPKLSQFSGKVQEAISNNSLQGALKLRLLREAAFYYHGICPCPSAVEYITIAKTLCNQFPQLSDKKPFAGAHWVSYVLMNIFSSSNFVTTGKC